MRRYTILLFPLMLTLLWGQRPTEGDDGGGEVDERDLPERIHLNVEKPVFDPELVQRVRKEKASRERAYIMRQLSGAHIERPKTFQVSLTKSRFAPIKRIMEQIRGEGPAQSVQTTTSRRLAITQQKDKKEDQAPALLKD
tara:strand:- start:174 stop:593 length:420 start_codon:yes stop_codon:yes gene_type:complete